MIRTTILIRATNNAGNAGSAEIGERDSLTAFTIVFNRLKSARIGRSFLAFPSFPCDPGVHGVIFVFPLRAEAFA
jgi:hypothetical protein